VGGKGKSSIQSSVQLDVGPNEEPQRKRNDHLKSSHRTKHGHYSGALRFGCQDKLLVTHQGAVLAAGTTATIARGVVLFSRHTLGNDFLSSYHHCVIVIFHE